MLDCQLYDLRPAGHHFTNVLLHTIATVLLFLVLRAMTGAFWRSAFVAAIFAVHPLRVESVAWIAERKDVLSGIFFMLTLGAYTRYTRNPSILRYIAMSILFACGLMSKPSVVTVPFVFLLLDYWPLKRMRNLQSARKCAIEKVPLLCLSAVSCVITLFAQRVAISSTEDLPFTVRVSNALVSYLAYFWQMIWPSRLAIFYSRALSGVPSLQVIGAAALLVGITAAVFILRSRQPYLVTGWLLYFGMLVPMIGIIQVGSQVRADRYTYLPQIGLYLMATWSVADITVKWPRRREILFVVAIVVLVALVWRAWVQTSYWKDNELLWRRTLAITIDNHTAQNNLGVLLLERGKVDEAISHLQAAVTIDPEDLDAQFNLANALSQNGTKEEAIASYKKILVAEPNRSDVETNLANALLDKGEIENATSRYRTVLQRDPSSAMAHYNLAVALHRSGRFNEAIVHYKEALGIQPDYPDADYNLGNALLQNGQFDEAKQHLEKR